MARKARKHIIEGYLPHDKFFVVNNDDPDLDEIKIKLPDPPPLPTIDGYGLPAKDQYFTRAKMPARLVALEERAIENLRIIELGSRHETVTGQKILEEIWRLFEEGKHNYKAEIEWVQKQIYFTLNGYWCYINGKPTFIDGWHYSYCCFWIMLDVTKNNGYPEYRDRDRRIYNFARYCYTTTEDENGIDVGFRTCFGFLYPKHRRDGATYKFLDIGYFLTIFKRGAHFGIQSFDDSNASEHYTEKLIPAWQNLPFFFKPTWQGSNNPRGELQFKLPQGRAYGKALGAKISYATTSNRRFYDGKKLYYYQPEEEGKCLGFGTKVLMYNGDIKQVQNITSEDVLVGDDKKPRSVLSVNKGEGIMYRVVPNKQWDEWECNGEHILSLICTARSMKIKDKVFYSNEVVDVTVEDYLALSRQKKQNLMLFRGSVEYSAKKHKIPSYLLGLWNGDGNKRGTAITNIDIEVKKYLEQYAADNNLFLSIHDHNRGLRISSNGKRPVCMCDENWKIIKEFESIKEAAKAIGIKGRSRISTACKEGKKIKGCYWKYKNSKMNLFYYGLQYYNLLCNKHIPEEFLIDSSKNRLELLAGLIDSDGHLEKKETSPCYEIVQKRERLSFEIKRLAISLGFYCSIQNKIATMKREDGSIYRCDVYRIKIYGDVEKIPCKIKRKKARKIKHNNIRAKHSWRSGFSIEQVGVGKYYGFVISGNRRFLLGDCTVTHNTVLENIYERWGTMKPCLSTGDSAIIHGFSIHPSTVSEMLDQGGMNFYYLSEDSKFNERDSVKHQTISGLFRLFIPAYDGLEGYIDKYGASIIDKPTPEQVKFTGRKSGAREQITVVRKMLLDKGTPESKAKYREHVMLFPTTYAECFRITSGAVGFDEEILDKRIEELRRKIQTVRGNFEWEDGVVDSRVVFTPRDDGRWQVSKQLSDSESNLKHQDTWFNPITGEDEIVWTPTFPTKYTLGADPFKFSTKGEASLRADKDRMSDGGGAVLRERDPVEDPGDVRSEWESDELVATYRYRPASDDVYAEDMLMGAVYFGALIFSENNIGIVNKHCIKRKYGGFLKYAIDEISGRQKETPGYFMGGGTKAEMMGLARNFIAFRGHKCKHLSFLLECKGIKGIEFLTNYDELAAVGASLMGSKSSYAKIIERANIPPDTNITNAFPIHRY